MTTYQVNLKLYFYVTLYGHPIQRYSPNFTDEEAVLDQLKKLPDNHIVITCKAKDQVQTAYYVLSNYGN